MNMDDLVHGQQDEHEHEHEHECHERHAGDSFASDGLPEDQWDFSDGPELGPEQQHDHEFHAAIAEADGHDAPPADVLAMTNPMALIERHLQEVHEATEQATRRLVELEEELDRRDYERVLHERQCEVAAAEIGQYRDALADAQDQLAGFRESSARADSMSITLEYERHLHDLQCSLAGQRLREMEQTLHEMEHAVSEQRQAALAALEQAEATARVDPDLAARVQELEDELSKRDYEREVYEGQCEEARQTIAHMKAELEAAQEAAATAAAAATSESHVSSDDHHHHQPAEIPEGHVVVAKTDIDQRDKAIDLLKSHIQSLRGELQKSRDQFTGLQKKMQEHQHRLGQAHENAGQEPGLQGGGSGNADSQSRRKQVTAAEVGSQLATVRAERQAVLEAKRMLEEAEQRLIRKWAPGRASSRLFWAVMTLGVLVAGSYFGVMLFVPAMYEASATVSVAPQAGSEMSGDDKAAWQTVHERLALDGTIIKATADRLRQRGMDSVASIEELTPLLQEHLIVSSPEPGVMQFSLSAKGNGYAQRVLETYTQAFVGQSKTAFHLRTDGGVTKILVPAMTNPVPLDEQQRTMIAAGVFAGLLVCCTLIGAVISRRLKRSSGLLSHLDDDDLFDMSPTTTDWDTSRLSETNVIS